MAGHLDSPIPDAGRLLDALGVAVVATDADTLITYRNVAAVGLLGPRFERAVGRELAEVLIAADWQVDAMVLAVIRRGEHWSGLLCVEHGDGNAIVVRSRWSPVQDKAGKTVGAIATLAADDGARHDRPSHTLAPLLAPRTPADGGVAFALPVPATAAPPSSDWCWPSGCCVTVSHGLSTSSATSRPPRAPT